MNRSMGVLAIQRAIIELRGKKVILDREIAAIYGVMTGALIQAMKRNERRFPEDFVFQLSDAECDWLVSQNVIPHRKYFGGRNPYAFTRNGANMLAAILRSPDAIQRSIQIMRAFSALEELLGTRGQKVINGPDILRQFSTHSRAIMQLFKHDKVKASEIARIRRIINEMIDLLKQMVFRLK